MKHVHTIIYVTGLGDGSGSWNVIWQRRVIRLWQLGGVKTRLFQMNWADKEPFQQKLERLLGLIDELSENGHRVSLVGISAGASAALAALSLRKQTVSGVVFICGKLGQPEIVQKSYYESNPAFYAAMQRLEGYISKLNLIDKQKTLSIRPFYDQTVPVSNTKVVGARQKIIPTVFHIPSIALAITVFAPITIFFLKRQAKIDA